MTRNRMTQINTSFQKQDIEVIVHIIDKLPSEYSEVITAVVEGMTAITLTELKNKIRAFYKRKFKTEKSYNEIALFAGGNFKSLCRNCGKQGHKSADCIKCFNCNKFACHTAIYCPEEKKKIADKKETSFFVGCAVEAEEKEEEIRRFGFISSDPKKKIIIFSIVHRVEEKNAGWPTLEPPVISHPVNLV